MRPSSLPIAHVYLSPQTQAGRWGLGWSTPLDIHLQISPDKSSVLLVDPVNLISVPLIRKSVDPQSLEGPLNDLLRAIENLDAVQSPDSRNELAETLRSDAKARAIYVERSRSKNLISDSSANLLTSAYSGYGYEILYESDGYHVERAGSGLTRRGQ